MNLALFDFDGTITVKDTFTPFILFAVRRRRLLLGGAVLGPLWLGYRLGFIPASRARSAVARFGFRGERSSALREIGLRYAREVLPRVLRRTALERIEWHKAQGDRVVVVSASLDVYLGELCQSLGVELICTELEERSGTLTGRYLRGDCCGEEKLRRICQRYDIQSYPRVFAYGDTEEDREMLGIAHEKYYRWREVSEWEAPR